MEPLIDRMPDDIERAVTRVLATACDRSLTLATAESCTGGLLAALLTDVEGCAHAFERGFVVYSEAAKIDLLDIDPALIAGEGAVSRPVALAMAKGALARSGADVALAITGFAGPGGPGDEPGLVHLACVRRGGAPAHREEHFGEAGRTAVRTEAIRVALAMMAAALG